MILVFSAVLCLAFRGCSQKTEEPENPFRPVSYQNEFFENGVLTSHDRTEYHYNEQGFQTEGLMFKNGVLTTTKQYEHDASGNILRVTSTTEDNTTVHDIHRTLDDQNRVLKTEESVNGILSYIMEYTYDKNGNVLTEIYTAMGSGTVDFIRHREMTCNRKGELIREILRNEDGTYTRYDYEDEKK
jgi:TusA-related sulfurtransferase